MNNFPDNITMGNVPMIDLHYNRHYITTDARDRVTSCWSDGPEPNRDTTGAICISNNEEPRPMSLHWAGGG